MGRILLLDSDPAALRARASLVQSDGHQVWQSSSLQEAVKHLSSSRFEAILTGHKLADGEGLQVTAAAQEADPTIAVVYLTSDSLAGLDSLINQPGIFLLLEKNTAPGLILLVLRKACAYTACRRDNLLLRAVVGHLPSHDEICGETSAMHGVRDAVIKLAPSENPVFITGEVGTEKDVVADSVHSRSSRSARPLLAVNCASIDPPSLRHRLFGEPGDSPTQTSPPGDLQAAHEGTIYLKEIDRLSPAAQERLMAGLTQGRIFPMGQARASTAGIDVRIIASTSRDLQQSVIAGAFREDLWRKLETARIHLPALRERKSDIPLLCAYYSQMIAGKLGAEPRTLSASALQKLLAYDFPGNCAELLGMLDRAYMFGGEKEIGPQHLPIPADSGLQKYEVKDPSVDSATAVRPAANFNLMQLLKETERTLIQRTLASTGGSQAEAARRMGISRSLLSYKINKYGIRALD